MATIRLLVATQDRDMLVSLLIFLHEETSLYVVGTASDVPSLLALIQSTQPDVVLVDELLIVDQNANFDHALALPESRPRLLVMAADENSTPWVPLADGLIPKYAPPTVLLERLKQIID